MVVDELIECTVAADPSYSSSKFPGRTEIFDMLNLENVLSFIIFY